MGREMNGGDFYVGPCHIYQSMYWGYITVAQNLFRHLKPTHVFCLKQFDGGTVICR